MINLNGKVVLITGGSKGIGKACVKLFYRANADVAFTYYSGKKESEQLEELLNGKGKIKAYNANVANEKEVEQLIENVLEDFGKIDILINNAGITRDASLKKMSTDQWQQVIDVNLSGVFYGTKAVAPYMMEKGSGRIISTSSVVALYGNFGQSNYVAAKAGVIGMTKTWARELGRKGITVNAIAPGFISTEMVALMPENVLASMREKVPMGRLGKPEEIASAFVFLASDEAGYVNGAVLSVDGGITI